ncbi:DUF2115 domain-containing protein [Methanofollis tationis]|uniref:UPF0305 protein HWN36_08120 n=1 Tax=Methanofollis tationis TaxID=81417 RepID=A0A7K4HPS8_9EURY|nr:DUF2115 domain-containing protein [Methanofollis tationis]NVO67274.1 DUF2115 domain-containing protein [Methanofollis tationis]
MPQPDAGQIARAASRLSQCRTRGELGRAIAKEAARFSLYDLQRIGGGIRREVEALPEPYRSRVRPYFEEQIFGAYHRLMCSHRSGAFARMDEPIPDPEHFSAFVALIPGGCLNRKGSQTDIGFSNPLHTLFYYLVTGYTIFVEGGPGHPVGTPFPGGFAVERRGNEYYCPIRDKEEDVPFSICNVCPARQTEGV